MKQNSHNYDFYIVIFLMINTPISAIVYFPILLATIRGGETTLEETKNIIRSIGHLMLLSLYLYAQTKRSRLQRERREYELRRSELSGVPFQNRTPVMNEIVISPYYGEYQKDLIKQRQNLVNKYDGVTHLIERLFG